MVDKTTTLKTKTGDNVYPNITGENRSNAIVDSPTIKHSLSNHKIEFHLDNTINNKINNSLQKPTGLAKTELVGVGANGQENIEIGDNLALANGKLSATGGGLSIIDGVKSGSFGGVDVYNIPVSQTAPFVMHINDDSDNQDIYTLVNVAVDANHSPNYYSLFRYEFNNYQLGGSDTTILVSKIPSSVSYQIVTTNSFPTSETEKIELISTIDMNNGFVELCKGGEDRGSYLTRTLAYDMSPDVVYIGQFQKFSSGKMGYYYLERISEKWYVRFKELSTSGA